MILYYILPFLLISTSFPSSEGKYTEETPVKLLEVESLADRYPATESKYRISVSNGFVSIIKNNSLFEPFAKNLDSKAWSFNRMKMPIELKETSSMGFPR